jgi:peptide subunit release factor 1 (eRF1)
MNDIQRLSTERSGSTTLITLYLKPGTGSKESASQKITKELAAADNIKSESTRKEVLSNLRTIQRNLKELKSVPEKGLAIFSGNGHYL